MQNTIHIQTDSKNMLYDITEEVRTMVRNSGVEEGIVNVYAKGATSAVMIQENWDESVRNDVIKLLDKLIPEGIWQHDHEDDNGAAHLKAGIVGPSETIPVSSGDLALSTWQNIFFCEFDGPHSTRQIDITIVKTR